MTLRKTRVALGSLLLVLITSCSRKAPPPKVDRLQWHSTTLVKYYNEHGQKNAAWDEDAKSALTAYARIRAGIPEAFPELASAATAARNAGCTDPMIEYLRCRFAPPTDDQTWVREYIKAAADLQASGYDPAHKFYGNLLAAEAIADVGTKNPEFWKSNISAMGGLDRNALNDLQQTITNRSISPADVGERCDEYLQFVRSHRRVAVEDTYQQLEGPLFATWSGVAMPYLVKGKYYFEEAWLARGNGTADQVSPDQRKLFSSGLHESESALEKAWSLDPTEPEIPTLMIRVVAGLEGGRAEMDRWFIRAMKLDPANYDACFAKLHYLLPQWYGSREEMLSFGRECVASTNWIGRVSLILVEAHYQLPKVADPNSYWRLPDVWPDIRAAYEKFFALNPDAKNYREYYARYALWCGHPREFLEQIALLKTGEGIDYAFWGGEEAFDKAVQTAHQETEAK